jgi:hypothetical protein
MYLILIVLLILLCVGGLPNVGVVNYGYGPSGIIGFILIVVFIFWILGRL